MAKKALLTVRISAEADEFIRASAKRFGKTIPTYLRDLIDYHASGKHSLARDAQKAAEIQVLELKYRITELEGEVRVLERIVQQCRLASGA